MTHPDGIKNRRSWWAVILTVTVSVIAASWVIERLTGDATDSETAGGAAENGGATTTPIQDYLQFAATLGNRPIEASGTNPETVVEGVRTLAGALGTLELGGADLQIDLRVAAEHILLNPAATANTAVLRDALMAAADALEPQHGNLRRLAESIRPDRPLLEQQMTIREFFRESARAIQTSANSSTVLTSSHAGW
jgi:hypothetical protein